MTGEKLNIPAMNSMTYSHTSGGTVSAMAATNCNVAMYRSAGGQSASLAYSKEQREEAAEEDEQKPA